ncbi:MAG: cation transporter [Mobilitalea sp.]
MKKIMEISGMSCGHCQARVEKALNEMDGVQAKVDLKKNIAVVQLSKEVSDDVLKAAVTEAGYEVGTISVKKGLFS